MKKLKIILGTIMAVALAAVAIAAPLSYKDYSTGAGTASGVTNNWVIIGALSDVPNAAPIVTYLNATAAAGDSTNGYVQFYDCTNLTYATAATVNSTTNSVGNTNGFTTSTIVIIRNLATDTYQRRTIVSQLSSNRIEFNTAPSPALAIGDIIYQQRTRGKIAFPGDGVKPLVVSGNTVYAGQKGYPLLIDCIGTNTPVINTVTATFR